jgi:hypothetical protein
VKKDLRWTGLTGVLAHLYVGTENDTGSYKIFSKVMAPTLGGEPNKKFKQRRSGTMDIGISVYCPVRS